MFEDRFHGQENTLKEILQEKKIRQSKLSRKADVSLNTIQVLYHNPYHDAVLSTLDTLARGLGVNVHDLSLVLADERRNA